MSEPSPTRPPAPATAHAAPAPGRAARPGRSHDHRAAHPLAGLHGALGNLGVLDRLPDLAIQPRLEVGAPDDVYEREADAVAARVMRSPDPAVLARGEPSLRRREDERKKPSAAPPPAPKAPPRVPKPRPAAKQPPKLRRPEEDHVATKAMPGAVPSVTPGVAATIQSQQGAGRGLSTGDRAFFEPRFGRDLGGVRLHDDGAAQAAARDVQAKAFTHGQDIYFSAGRYHPSTAGGRELLAHELAHTVQQRPGAPIGRRVQRVPETPKPPPATTAPATPAAAAPGTTPTAAAKPAPVPAGAQGVVRDDANHVLTFPTLAVPAFRLSGARGDRYRNGPLKRARGYSEEARRRLEPQRNIWVREMRPALAPRITAFLKEINAEARDGRYLLKSATARRSVPRFYFGTAEQMADPLSTPEWDDSWRSHGQRGFEVDHILELQISGYPPVTTEHAMPNFELLDEAVNFASGDHIKNALRRRVQAYILTVPVDQRAALGLNDWRNQWDIVFLAGVAPTASADAEPAATRGYKAQTDHWTREQIAAGHHLVPLVLHQAAWSELGSADQLRIFQNERGGFPSRVNTLKLPNRDFLAPFTLSAIDDLAVTDGWEQRDLATFWFTYNGRQHAALQTTTQARPIPIQRLPGQQFAGYISKRHAVDTLLAHFVVPAMSPVEFDDLDFMPGKLVGRGRIVTDLPLIAGSAIDLELDGYRVTVSKTFDVGDFRVPAPLHIDQSELKLSASTDGDLAVDGQVDLSIDRVGQGSIRGSGSTRRGFGLDGRFTFSSDIFEHPRIEFGYHEGHFSGSGHLGLAAGKVPGLRRGTLDVAYANERLEATGHAQFDLPGVREADVHLVYDRELGLTIGGTVALGEVPGLRSGTLSLTIAERPGAQGYRITAHGDAEPAIPGIDTRLEIDYDDGAFTAQGRGAFSRGLITGRIQAGATNRPVGEDGRIVADGAPTPNITVFGAGLATLQLTPWLRGDAEIRLLPNGEISVAGELVVAGLNLWQPIEPEPTSLLHPPTLEFPIFGPVVLEIGGELLLKYGVGAGVLAGRLHIDYNPAHEDQTHILGSLGLHTSAFAGLELDVFVGLGLDAWIGHISGRILVGAELRAEADVNPSIAIDWTPGRGVVLDPLLEAHLTPKLVFHLDAVVAAGVGPFEKEWHKELARREFGSSLAMGITVPSHYEEATGFFVDWNRKQLTYPELNPLTTAKDFLLSLV